MNSIVTAKALEQARALVAELESYDGSVEQQHALLNRASTVRATMEGPYEMATRWLESMSIGAAMNLIVRAGALEKVPSQGSVSVATLAAACNVDRSVITRAMRMLVVSGIFTETGRDEYAHNPRSAAFDPRHGLGGFVGVCMDIMQSWIGLPEYCRTHEPRELLDPKKSPFAFTAGMEGKTYYEVLETDLPRRELWDITLQSMASNFPVLGMFPFKEHLAASAGEVWPERPAIVDVGGGRGQALLQIQGDGDGAALNGRLVLQDLATVIETLKPDDIPGIETMVYDIFTPQPVKGARIYLMRRLLHDFYDPQAIEILRNTASAMAPDSRLVICDMIVPDLVQVNGRMTLYWLDFSLVTIGGKERSKPEFENICEQAGLEIVKIYPSHGENTAMLETRLKR
ncbi:hypothetical protein LLEC1_05119 [Akanthomyces lecanii]|uniref:O-methyltransferase C-terminal domain-containing protein n=1 Tax=Cordyceps confragosa TaxID=2714763 RepID=A0A179IU72_CORDF|nr:hypothetical protein LLEC1_05119 [Akanthomyces lecanii]